MRRFLIPEAIQTSAMDCGPACLKSVLEGFGIAASYGRLREACQTDVDGTSIDTVEEAAVQLGLDASQVMLPLDHLLEPAAEALPAIVVIRQPNGATHFVIIWRRHGSWIQVMDPSVGRRWVRMQRFLEDVYEHVLPVPVEGWLEWAASDSFRNVLRDRMRRLGAALTETEPKRMARLDAAVRMVEHLADSGAVHRGRAAERLIDALANSEAPIPDLYWTARPENDGSGQVVLRGAVLIRVKGRSAQRSGAPLSAELEAALREKPSRPGLELLRLLFSGQGVLAPALTLAAIALAAAGSVAEALLLRGLYDLARELTTSGQRTGAIGATIGFVALLVALEFAIAVAVLRTGRVLDVRLRLRFLHKIPRLADRYFRSRPSSDMAERSHNVHQLRQGPELAANFARAGIETLLTVLAIGWLFPAALWPSAAVAFAAVAIPLLAQPLLTERDLKLRSHAGALMRFNLDSLLGITATRAHGAAPAVRREQGALLGEWARAGFSLQRTATLIEGLQMAASFGLAAWVVWTGLTRTADVAGALLLVYWVLNLPALGQDIAAVAWQYPMLRNTALRFVEPLGAPEEPVSQQRGVSAITDAVSVRLDAVSVVAGGHRILEDVSIEIPAGSHVGIVGRSGAGKSSLVGLLLGWHRPSAGTVQVDGRELDGALLDELRPVTAWVDPQVQIWNRSLYENLIYGTTTHSTLDEVLDQASLASVVANLPDGMQTSLGEGGGLVSGGEGQRVRLGRAMARDRVRLVILDEPARGLDRTQRRLMIDRARERWSDATMLCITHDVSDTQDFERVLVIEDGHVVQDGDPAELAGDTASRYRQLLDAEMLVSRGLWTSSEWRRLRLESGQLWSEDASVEEIRHAR